MKKKYYGFGIAVALIAIAALSVWLLSSCAWGNESGDYIGRRRAEILAMCQFWSQNQPDKAIIIEYNKQNKRYFSLEEANNDNDLIFSNVWYVNPRIGYKGFTKGLYRTYIGFGPGGVVNAQATLFDPLPQQN